MIIGLELLHTWLASSNYCSSPLVLTKYISRKKGKIINHTQNKNKERKIEE